MQQFKIAHLTSAHLRHDIRIFHKECTSLAQNNFKVSLLVADGKGNEINNGIEIQDIGARGNRLKRFLLMPWKMWLHARKLKADLYHFHDPDLLIIGFLLKLEGYKVIYDTHEDLPRQILSKYYIPLHFRKFISFTIELLENFISKRLSGIITATPHINKRFIKINNLSKTVNNYPLASEIENCLTINGERIKNQICYTGGVTRIRGIVEIIEAIKNLDVTLVIAGPMESTSLQNELEQMPGWSKVNYLGTVSRKTVYEIMERSSLGLLLYHPEPNHTNAQPNKLFEYMAAKLPVLASNFPLWEEIIKIHQFGICVNPLDPKAISEGIVTMLTSGEIEKMGTAASQAVLNQFNWKNEEKVLINFYKLLLTRK